MTIDDLPAYLKESIGPRSGNSCLLALTDRGRCGEWRYRRLPAAHGRWASQRCSTVHPAGGDAGAAGGLRPDVLRDQLRLPAGALGASGGGAGATVHRVRHVDIDLEKFFDRVNHDILMRYILAFYPHLLDHAPPPLVGQTPLQVFRRGPPETCYHGRKRGGS